MNFHLLSQLTIEVIVLNEVIRESMDSIITEYYN